MHGDGGGGVVAAGDPAVAEAAARLLRDGGNAFDAAAAAGFAAAVCEPALTSLGGGGFLLAREARGTCRLFDFFTDTPGHGRSQRQLEPHFEPVTVVFPGSEQVFNVGLGAVAVPGTLRGLLHFQALLGRAPLAEVVAPAVACAREGIVLGHHGAYFLALLEPIFTMHEEGRRIVAPAGRLLRQGERLRNPELADFLENLPRTGDAALYSGALAERIVADMDASGGLLTRADLAGYAVFERAPLELPFAKGRLFTNPLPSFGGTLLGAALARIEAAQADARTAEAGIANLLAAMRSTEDAREEILGAAREGRRFNPRGTTHVSVIDAEGNAAAMTTSNGEGSGYFVPGTGIQLNNMMGEDDLHPEGFHASPPGLRVASMMSPSVWEGPDGRLLALGSGGSKRIRTALLQVLTRVLHEGRSLAEAVAHPRIHWDGERVQVEAGLPEAALAALAGLGPLNVWDTQDVYFGGVHAVDSTGQAGADSRRGGAVAFV